MLLNTDNYSNNKSFEILNSFVENTSNADGVNESLFEDMDFSEIRGKTFKSSLKRSNDRLKKKGISTTSGNKKSKNDRVYRKTYVKPGQSATISDNDQSANPKKTTQNIIVSSDQRVVINGVSNFMLDNSYDSLRTIGYYKGEKLKELLLTFNNTTGNDLTIDIFNPTGWGKYLIANRQDLDDRIIVGGGQIPYSQAVFSMIGAPPLIANCKFQFVCPDEVSLKEQLNQTLNFKNSSIQAYSVVKPNTFTVDYMQYQVNVNTFDIIQEIARPFFPDGTDTLEYTIKAGSTVVMCFYYKHFPLVELLYKEGWKKENQLQISEY